MKLSLPQNETPSPSSPRRRVTTRALWAILALACALIALLSLGAATSTTRELPDARTWHFFSEKRIRARLYYAVPGVADSIRVSDDPACCPMVSPNGRWVACTNFNSKAIESELLIISRQSDQWRPIPGYTVIGYQWSPDGMSIAGYGKRRTAGTVCFFAVQPLSRSAWFADSLSSPEDYEFAWDSTSTRVAICRPGSGGRDPSRVLLLNFNDRKVKTISSLTSGEPAGPRWLPDSTLVVTKKSSTSGDSLTDLHFSLPRR
jgi:hypothetical protein